MLPTSCLRDFMRSVPVYPETATLAEALDVLSLSSDGAIESASECLVLTTLHGAPIGLVNLQHLLPLLLPELLPHVQGSVPAIAAETRIREVSPTIVEPIVALAAEMSIADALAALQVQAPGHIAIVDEQGSFLGLLDRLRLLRFLAATAPLPARSSVVLPLVSPSQVALTAELKRQLRPLLAEAIAPAPYSGMAPLMELLERLPLPLMLQTGTGQVLMQNLVWREQVGELLDPGWIRQEAAPLLEQTASLELAPGLSPPVCQLGDTPDTCICTCPLKSGQERSLQFVKIAIGPLSPLAPAAQSPASLQTASGRSAQVGAVPFRLAALATIEPPLTPIAPVTTDAESLWLILAQDLTEQQQLAKELTAKNADLIQLNRLKDEFLACISHELRTPLTAVLGLSSLLKDKTIGELNQRQLHYAQLIYQSGRHLMTVVNDILDLTRMETGQLELMLAPVEIAAVCDRAFEQAKQLRLADDKAAILPEFSQTIEPGLGWLIADELRLRQMVMHLLSNALKFTDDTQQIGLNVSRWGGWIALTVWDTGIGIPADKQHLIFQKFQQLENPLTRRFDGTGLGLVLTQRLARLHGGDITFISKEGQGSQFTILLPPSPPGQYVPYEDEIEPARSPAPNFPSGRVPVRSPRSRSDIAPISRGRLVLVVEAAPQSIETLSNQLTGLGYWVVIARSGTEALEKARRLQPCIVFLDPVLPQLSGWDVLTLLKSDPETRQLAIVLLATRVDEEQAYRSPADGLLSLPVQTIALEQTLKQLVMSPPESRASLTPLTVLRLSPGNQSAASSVTDDLSHLLQSRSFRILEADDLEQADLLARVWKPNVVLLDGKPALPDLYFQQFVQHSFLSALPLVTLEQETTQAANRMPELLVFPCLAGLEATLSTPTDLPDSALLQALQVAAGQVWRSSILTVDLATLPLIAEAKTHPCEDELGQFPKEGEWLQALTQYLQTAGLRGLVGRSWPEVLQQLQSQSVDLLLIGWTGALSDATIAALAQVQQLESKPPILVLDHRSYRMTPDGAIAPPIPSELVQLATKILPPALSMSELLKQIQQAIT